ncbi:hypothetical protein GCM10007916_30100 [Psychromonas marina]|uniref:DUF945 family protein n=1 Tax=Psychromonas marina TaxID=88364 RepID=A0ABQ6E413_9GAMM|nr:hypothetical protein [Psychromonas marina]GLS91940.1 hypothetical protein GCM10007916_30100 [Psychromonas marina]
MNKTIIAGAILAAGAGAVIMSQQDSTPSYNVLDYIPADTPLFAAQLEPFPLKNYIASAPRIIDPNEQQASDENAASTQPGASFLLSLIKSYEAGLTDADLLVKTFGLPDDVRAYFYTLGLLPVFKIEIANEQAFWDLLDKAELDSGFSHKAVKLQTISYRAYAISDPTDPVNAEVIVAIDKGLLTITFNSAHNEETLLASALGLTKAEHSIADSGKVEQIIKQHNFQQASVGFIDHVELIKGLTTQDGNQLATQLSTMQQKLGTGGYLEQIRTEQCASELATIAANWPRTVAGYTQLDITAKESTIGFSTVVESNNQVILNALTALRGFIPKYTSDVHNNVLAMGLGLDSSEFSHTLNTVWRDLQTPAFSCQPLAEIQTQISQSGDVVGMAGMSANFTNGLQGVSAGLLDYSISKKGNKAQLDSLDALFTISADTPEQLFNSAKMFLPALQHVQLTSGGEPIALNTIIPIPPEMKIDPKVAIKGNHLVIYSGDKGEKVANALASESLSKNGLFDLSFDFKKMVTPIITATELAGEEIPEEAMFLTEYDARMQLSIDTNQEGLIFKSEVNNKAPK